MELVADPFELAWMRAQVRSRLFGADPVVRVDRFELKARLGSGAMGTVWLAHDPELSRDVAIKTLLGGDDGDRLRREAQAMARLRHPNVVAVHEIGTWRGISFVAMERVEGPTVRAWLAAERRTVDEVMEVFVGAGRGLAAAHQAGLVHRDFKPDNVLVDSSGLARVADFGLARHEDAVAGDPVAGTPAYMAPEQLRGGAASTRSDQFAFAVALSEALRGQRPRPRARKAIERARAADPDARFADLNTFLAELAPRERNGNVWLGAAALVLAGGAAIAVVGPTRGPAPVLDVCGGGEEALGDAWNPARAAQVEAAITGAGTPYATATAARTVALLDDYAARWQAMFRQSCEATRVFRTQSVDMLGRRQACLVDRRRVLDALAGELASGDAGVVERAVPAASGLPSLERCGDLGALRQRRPPPDDPVVAASVAAISDELARARAAELAGHYQAAHQAAAAAVPRAEALAYAPLTADALLVFGRTASRLGTSARSQAALERSFTEALAGGDDALAADAALAAAFTAGFLGQDLAEGQRWAALADAQLRRLGDAPVLRAALANTQANLAQAGGDFPAAQAGFARAAAVYRRVDGDHRIELGGALLNEGNALEAMGRFTDALARLAEAEGIWRETVGDAHPQLAMVHNSLANTYKHLDRFDDAITHARRALEIDRGNLGEAHPDYGMSVGTLGNTYLAAGDDTAALAELERAEDILRRALGPDHLVVSMTITNRALALVHLGRLDEAEPLLRQALAAKEKARGDRHPSLLSNLGALAEIELRRSRPRDALAFAQRALAIAESGDGADPDLVADALTDVGRAQLQLHDVPAGRAALERALEQRGKAEGVTAATLSIARYQLARARWQSGDHAEARTTALETAAVLAGTDRRYAAMRAEVAAWLAEHPQ